MLQKIRRGIRGRLNALFIVDVHVEVGAVLFGERDPLIVDERRVFDRSDARANRILDALRGVRVRRNAQPKVIGLLNRRAQLFRGEFDGFWIASMSKNRAGGQDLDVIRAAMRKFPNFLTHFPRAVRHAVLQIPWQLDIR